MLISRVPLRVLSGALLSAVDLGSTIAQPFLIQILLVHRSSSSLAAMFTVGVVGGFCAAHSTYCIRRLGLSLRTSLTSLICTQILRDPTSAAADAPQTPVLLESDLPKIHEFIEQSNLL